jgi:hypothetical protein
MRAPMGLCILCLAACSSGPSADLQYIKQARSIGAEWALVNEQAQADQLTSTYVESMHQWLRDGLSTASSSLTEPRSAYGAEIRALLAEPADAAPETLRDHVNKLKRIEDQLESA